MAHAQYVRPALRSVRSVAVLQSLRIESVVRERGILFYKLLVCMAHVQDLWDERELREVCGRMEELFSTSI